MTPLNNLVSAPQPVALVTGMFIHGWFLARALFHSKINLWKWETLTILLEFGVVRARNARKFIGTFALKDGSTVVMLIPQGVGARLVMWAHLSFSATIAFCVKHFCGILFMIYPNPRHTCPLPVFPSNYHLCRQSLWSQYFERCFDISQNFSQECGISQTFLCQLSVVSKLSGNDWCTE